MRRIENNKDIQIVLRQLQDWQSLRESKDWDFRGLRIKRASDATEDQDYVTLAQVKRLLKPAAAEDQFYSIPFNNSGTVNDNDAIAPFIVGPQREGYPFAVTVAAITPPSTENLVVNMALRPTTGSSEIILLNSDLSLPVGEVGPVRASNFISPFPKLGYLSLVYPKIISGGGAALVCVSLVVKRIL